MITIGLLSYIRSIIEKDDQYALEVLYFCLRRTFEKNYFTFNGIQKIRISERFHSEPVTVKLSEDYSLQKSIALLLSVRAIMLKPRLVKYCVTEELFFKSKCLQPYEWVSFSSILFSLREDEDFYSLYCMLEDAEYDGKISDSLIQEFLEQTIIPPYKNLDNYYKKMASAEIRNNGIVIVDNAYLDDETLTHLEIPEPVEYIGNTAFAYCENLQEIVFLRDDIKFGAFPIIECSKLKTIIVPEGSKEYYAEQLPFYKNIISERKLDKQDKQLSCDEDNSSSENKSFSAVELNSNFKKIEEVFKNKATTYKYFWFLAILELIEERKTMSLNYSEIIPRMVALAWNLLNKKISFAPKDSLPNIINTLKKEFGIHLSTDVEKVEKLICKNYTNKTILKSLAVLKMNVPYRFLSPWVRFTTNDEVKVMSQSVDCDAPYALYEDYIVLDETWYDYFIEKYEELHTFTRKSLIDYLKSYNSELVLLQLMMSDKIH